MFGGAAPDALAALVPHAGHPARRARQHHDRRASTARPDVDRGAVPAGAVPRPTPSVLDGVSLLGDGTRLRHALGAPGGHHPRHRLPAGGRLGRRHRSRSARPGSTCGSRRAPTPTQAAGRADRAPARAPHRGASQVTVGDARRPAAPFRADTDGPAYAAMRDGDARGVRARRWRCSGRAGRSRCATSSHETYPDAEIILMGVEEPLALIHAPNESVDPTEIAAWRLGRGALPPGVRHRKGMIGTCPSS